jgi:transposase
MSFGRWSSRCTTTTGERTRRPPAGARAALTGIVFVLTTGIAWNALPLELGCGSGVTCWRRLRAWQQAGVWARLHRLVLDRLAQQGTLDWTRAAVDSVSVRAKRRGEATGPNPTDRGKAGSKYHVLCDRHGLPLHVQLTGANTHDSTMLVPLLETNPGVRERAGRPGRPRRRPDKLHADKGYDYPRCRRYLHQRGIKVRIARRGIEDKTRLGRVRWVVERTMAWLLDFRRLALRYDRTESTVSALLSLACSLICHRRLR